MNPVRIIVSVLTLLVLITTVVLAVLALTIPSVGLFVTCLMIAAGFGYFSYRDFRYFFVDKK